MDSFYVFVYKEALEVLKNFRECVEQNKKKDPKKDYDLKNLREDLRKDIIKEIIKNTTISPTCETHENNKEVYNFDFENKRRTANAVLGEIREGYTKLGYKVIDLKFKTKKNFIVGTRQGPLYLVFEVGLSWDPILDLPFIPGSSLKGAIRSYMLDLCRTKEEKDTTVEEKKDEIKKCVENVVSLFGVPTRDEEIARLAGYESSIVSEEGSEGLAIFSDAYPIDFSDTYGLLTPDIITPHYYKGGEVVDNEFNAQPTPITFLTVAPEVTFRSIIAVSGEGEKYVKELSEMFFGNSNSYSLVPFILFAFTMGIGAKTSRGYGEFDLADFEIKGVSENKARRSALGVKKLEE